MKVSPGMSRAVRNHVGQEGACQEGVEENRLFQLGRYHYHGQQERRGSCVFSVQP